MTKPNPTASMIVIGNEILSGRTQDKNLHWLGGKLAECGVRLAEASVIPDVEAVIIDTVNRHRASYDYVFTSGGIGPTHDDITTACIAKAFGVNVILHPEAERILHGYYPPQERTPERMKMACVPESATLIPNAVSAAPGFRIGNMFIMAGVPSIFQSMFMAIRHELNGGSPIRSITYTVYTRESEIATPLEALQTQFGESVDFGSYPFARADNIGTRLVATSSDAAQLEQASTALSTMLKNQGLPFEAGDI